MKPSSFWSRAPIRCGLAQAWIRSSTRMRSSRLGTEVFGTAAQDLSPEKTSEAAMIGQVCEHLSIRFGVEAEKLSMSPEGKAIDAMKPSQAHVWLHGSVLLESNGW